MTTQHTPQQTQESLLTLAQAAERRGVHPKPLQLKIRSGELVPAVPGMRGRGGAALFTIADVDRLDFLGGGRPRKARKVELADEVLTAIQRVPAERRSQAWLRKAREVDPASVTAVARRYVTRSDVMPDVEEFDAEFQLYPEEEGAQDEDDAAEARDEREEAEREAYERWLATRTPNGGSFSTSHVEVEGPARTSLFFP